MADIPRVKFSSPWTVANIEAELNGVKTARGSGTMSEALAAKQDLLVVGTNLDSEPTAGSNNPVRSGGVVNFVYGAAANTIPTGANLNTYTAPGSYRCESNAIAETLTNCPVQNGFRMEVMSTIASAATGYQIQTIYPNNALGKFYMRRRGSASSGTWSNWFEFAGTEIQPVSPFPADCPFTCDEEYFVNSAVSVSINGTTFAKSNSGYAIGMVIAVNVSGTGICTGVMFMSPVSQDAVKYTPYHDYWNTGQGDKTVTLDGVTWYCANPGGATLGDFRSGTYDLAVYPNVLDWHTGSVEGISESDLLDVLAAVNAANRTV